MDHVEVLDAVRRDADRVVLCRCGGFGRVHHVPVQRRGLAEGYVRGSFTCPWDRPGPHVPLLPPGGRSRARAGLLTADR
ncbi:hypothetical protein [Modestobacter marinus]|uniref:hypothetical protein n=1 Tax=Modestobacter marinus TaxID=477641 RepID=UPI001C982CDC|nr:hypothetical protein [Modestobacter marinus]